MKNFSQIRNEINIQNNSLLTEEFKIFGVDETNLIESIDILSKNLILASLITEQISDSEIKEIVDSIPLDVDKLEDYMIQTKNNIVIVNWDGSKASVEVDGKEIDIPGVVNNPEALRGAVEGILQDYPMSEEVTQDDLADVLYNIPTDTKELVGKEFDVNGDKLSIDWNSESGAVKVSLNGKSIDIKDKAYDLESLAQAIMKAVGSDSKEKEEPKKDEKPVTDPETKKKLAVLNSIIKPRLIYKYANTSTDRNRVIAALTDYIKTGSDESKATADLDQRALVDLLFDLVDVLVTNRNLATLVTKNATAASVSESVILEAKKKSKKSSSEETVDVKLDMLLKLGLVDQKLYNRAKKALSNKKAAGTVPYLRNLLFDLLDRLISYIKKDPTLYNRIRINVMKEMKGILPTKKDIDEASCAGKKAAEEGKEKEVPESYSRHYFTKEAWLEGFDSWDGNLTVIDPEEEEMETFKEFTEAVGETEDYIGNGKMMKYHRNAISLHRNREEDYEWRDLPAKAEKHGIAADAHEDAYYAYAYPTKNTYSSPKMRKDLTNAANKLSKELNVKFNEEQETNESVKLSELNVINDVINGLEVLSTTSFGTLEEAQTEIKTLLQTIGLTFDTLKDGEVPLESIDGDSAVLSVFSSDDSVEEQLEGDMVLKCSISEGDGGVTISAEIMVYFEDGELIALNDVEFEPDQESESEEEPEEPEESDEVEESLEGDDMSDSDWYDEYKDNPLYIKITGTGSGVSPNTYKINKIEKVDNKEVLVYFKQNKQTVEYSVNLSGSQNNIRFYVNRMPITIRQAVKLYDYSNNIKEEFETGKVFNVILFKPSTRRFLSSIIHANSVEEVEKIVSDEMPLYTIHSIDPIEVKDTTK